MLEPTLLLEKTIRQGKVKPAGKIIIDKKTLQNSSKLFYDEILRDYMRDNFSFFEENTSCFNFRRFQQKLKI